MDFKSYNYSEKERSTLLNSITVICDSREQSNKHITDWFDTKSIPHISQKLDYGDYTFKIPTNVELGINRDLYFDNDIVIERKNSLVELSGNIAQERERFEREWLRFRDCKKILLIENGSYDSILDGRYNTLLKSKSYIASILTFKYRYNIDIQFIGSKWTAQYIYSTFYYFLREKL
jgi:ERCC4-type nuclease